MRAHHSNEQVLADLNGNACRGKVRHPSKAIARASGRAVLQRGRDNARSRYVRLNVYKCKICHAWHLGHINRAAPVDASALVRLDVSPLERALAAALAPYLVSFPQESHAEVQP